MTKFTLIVVVMASFLWTTSLGRRYSVTLYNHGFGEPYIVWMEMTLNARHIQSKEIPFNDYGEVKFSDHDKEGFAEVDVYFYKEQANDTIEIFADPLNFEPRKFAFCFDITGIFANADSVRELKPCPSKTRGNY